MASSSAIVPDSNVGLDAGGGNLGISRRGMDRLPLQLPVGLWDEWKDKASGETLKSCTLIRSSPSQVSEVHDRMPVLLAEKDYETVAERHAGLELLKPAADRPNWVRFANAMILRGLARAGRAGLRDSRPALPLNQGSKAFSPSRTGLTTFEAREQPRSAGQKGGPRNLEGRAGPKDCYGRRPPAFRLRPTDGADKRAKCGPARRVIASSPRRTVVFLAPLLPGGPLQLLSLVLQVE